MTMIGVPARLRGPRDPLPATLVSHPTMPGAYLPRLAR